MENDILTLIDGLIEYCDKDLINDTKALIKIKSVQGEAKNGAPFGEQPLAVLEKFKAMCQEAGLFVKDYEIGFVSGSLSKAPIDVGIWLHGDVVPEGDGWSFDPYNATVYKNCIIGRGSNDNKGQLCAIYNLFKIFKKLDVKLNYNPAIFLGSNEENGMKDLVGDKNNPYAKGFLNCFAPPRLSLVSDGGFPLGYGGKGGLNITLKSKTKLENLTLEAGLERSPGSAVAVIVNCPSIQNLEKCVITQGEKTVIESYSPPLHASRPDPEGNMVTYLTKALLENNLVRDENRYILEFFNKISLNVYGQSLGIASEHAQMGKLTVFIKQIVTEDGYAKITLNIRYPLPLTFEKIVEDIRKSADKSGFCVVDTQSRTVPYIANKDSAVAKMLADTSKEIPSVEKKERDEPYILEGGTYAHFLPNAYVYGMNASVPPIDFEKGKGLSHGVDEAVSIPRLKRAMRIYARALLRLNDMDF